MKNLVRRLFYVPKCASCSERLAPIIDKDELNHGLPCFCPDCLSAWHRAKSQMCHSCGKPADACVCMPIKNVFAQPTIPSLFFYHPSEISAQSRAIYTLKRKNYTDLIEFFAQELSPRITDLLSLLELSPQDCVFTYIPRTERAKRTHGFDQSELLSRQICLRVGGACMLPLLTRRGGREQKLLSPRQRARNVETTIFANTKLKGFKLTDGKTTLDDFLSGKAVVLIDDVITSGASVGRGIRVLREHGARCVIVASIARCEVKKKAEKPKI